MTSKELLKEIESWLSFNTEPSKEETAKLRKSIKDHLAEQINTHKVSVRELIVGDIIYTQDGRRWVITEINGDDLLVDGNGRRNYPLEKCDVSHTFYDIKENSQDLDTDIVDMVNEEFWNLI